MAEIEVRIPDIGDFADVPVIEIHVAPGEVVAAEDPLVTLESDKATLDVPAPAAGTVGSLLISLGDMVSEGTPILILQAEGGEETPRARAACRAGKRCTRRPGRRRTSRPGTAHRPGCTSGSRSPSPTSATSPTCRSSRSTWPLATRSRPRTR